MPNDGVWVFVDDLQVEANAFAVELERTALIRVEVLSPNEARTQLLKAGRWPAGVLMDVDLSSIADELGTGPGIAQDIRTKQKAKLAKEFPIVRFSAAEPLQRNVLGDPSSDDLFELKIPKNDLKVDRNGVVSKLLGLTEVYELLNALTENLQQAEALVEKMFGIDAVTFTRWGHDGLIAKILSGIGHAQHVAASVFCRFFLIPHGLLIDSKLLSIRLGIDADLSHLGLLALAQHLDNFKYSGVAHQHFDRWWARGLEEWWFQNIDSTSPIAAKTPAERVVLLSKKTGVDGLVPLAGPEAQEQFRPWRFCRLGLESEPPEYIPIDPGECVRLTPQGEFPAWVDPLCSSLKLAMRARGDARLNQRDFDRLRKKYGV
jgi:hypothetical protein